MINIYCDESCHLPNDDSPLMVIGGMSCPEDKVRFLSEQIRNIKKKHCVYEFAEIKWTKVSKSKIQMYLDLIDLFFDSSFLQFRAVIAMNKKKLNYEKFNLTHDDWYQRIYYLVLREMIEINKEYSIYVDIKDTKGNEKIEKLKEVLNKTLYDFYNDTVKNIQLVSSDQVQLLQLTDLIIGAVSYSNRGLYSNKAKLEIINRIIEKSGRSLLFTSPKQEVKFNLFKWFPKEV